MELKKRVGLNLKRQKVRFQLFLNSFRINTKEKYLRRAEIIRNFLELVEKERDPELKYKNLVFLAKRLDSTAVVRLIEMKGYEKNKIEALSEIYHKAWKRNLNMPFITDDYKSSLRVEIKGIIESINKYIFKQ